MTALGSAAGSRVLVARRGRRDATAADLTPTDLLVVQATLAAGAGPADALAAVTSPALAPVQAALRVGEGFTAIAQHHTSGLPPAAGTLVRAMAVAEVVGAAAAPAAHGVLAAVRAAVRLQALIRIRSAQAVMSARLLIALPLVAAGALAALDGAARGVLASPLGVAVLLLAGLLITLAALWIRRLLGRIAGAGSRADPLVVAPDGAPPVLITAVGLGLATALVTGPAVGVAAAGLMALAGPAALRALRRHAPQPTGRSGVAPLVPGHPGALPTVEAIELLALALSAGVGLAEACRVVARLGPPETRPAFSDITARLRTGTGPAAAFPAQLAELATLIELADRWGAPTAEALRLLAGDIRDRAATAAEEAAERLTVQLVFPTTLLLVPAFGLLVVVPLVASSLSGIGLDL